MSIQSATTSVLAAMRRKYTAEHVEMSLQAIASEIPGAFVGMDVIVGFPGESEDDFAETYERLNQLPWTRIHVFPYSERPGTKAASFADSVPRSERTLRSERLRQLSNDRYASLGAQQIGLRKRALVLKSREGVEGLTRDYWPVTLMSAQSLTANIGSEIEVEILGFDGGDIGRMVGKLQGRVVEPS
jgi:threonylcarbamoyladenosine tRNA methylthiotransferase MtaB